MSNGRIFIIVPVYNEAGVVRETVAPMVEAGYTVVVVDDGSTDGSARTLDGLRVVILRHAANLGQGAAIETGRQYALRHDAKIALHFDADGQHSRDQIPEFVAPILRGETDVVLGSRFLRGTDAARTPPLRRVILRIGTVVSGLLTGVWLTDTHNGFRALSRRALEQIELRENGFAHATEILGAIRRKRLRYVEVPTAILYTDYSRAKGQSLWNSFSIVFDLLLGRLFR
jgi:glycosyltransferase involved in cell wall biosynthesis